MQFLICGTKKINKFRLSFCEKDGVTNGKSKRHRYRMIIENHGGRWMFVNDDIYSFMECSGCKEQVLIKDVEKYCPNCGAKLEGVGD